MRVKRMKGNIKRQLAGNLIIISEKNNIIITARESTVRIYSLQEFKLLKVLNVKHTSQFCMNSQEDRLYCMTTSNELYIFDVTSWECIQKNLIRVPYKLKESEWFELSDIFYYDKRYLLAISLGARRLLGIDILAGNADLMWTQDPLEDGETWDIRYDAVRNTLVRKIRTHKEMQDDSPINNSVIEVKSLKFAVDLFMETIKCDESTIFIDAQKRFMVHILRDYRLFRKTKTYLKFFDFEKGTENKTQYEGMELEEIGLDVYSALPRGKYIDSTDRIMILDRKVLAILRKKSDSVEVEEVIENLCDMEDFQLYQDETKLIAIGGDYGFVLDLKG